MTIGPIVAGGGLALLTRVGAGSGYLSDVFPAVTVFALGLSLTVAPLTTTVLAAASEEHAGIASAVNNDVARAAGLLAVAALPIVVGLTASAYRNPSELSSAFHSAMVVTAGMCVAGGLLAWATIRNPSAKPAEVEPVAHLSHCALDATPLAG
jgi:hypothetical protein